MIACVASFIGDRLHYALSLAGMLLKLPKASLFSLAKCFLTIPMKTDIDKSNRKRIHRYDQAPVVGKVDGAINWKNLYTLD